MDLNKLTIPPDLFYSKRPNDIWKPRKVLAKITPEQITKEFQKIPKAKVLLNAANKGKKFRNMGPELGRIGKVRSSLMKKKLIKKTNKLQEKSVNVNTKELENNNDSTNRKKEQDLLKKIKENGEEIQKKFLSNENFSPVRKRNTKRSSFKFFKTRNARESEEESDESDDLVQDIRDFASSSPEANKSFELSEAGKDEKANGIENLLKEFDYSDEDEGPSRDKASTEMTLENLIATLEGSPPDESKTNEETAEDPKINAS